MLSLDMLRPVCERPSCRRFPSAGRRSASCSVAREPAGSSQQTLSKKSAFAGVVFDMDGTLTQSNIDFENMRRRLGIFIIARPFL